MPTIPTPPQMPHIPDSVRFAAALGQFSHSMQRLSHLQSQTSTRLSKLIRLGMIALVILFASVFIMMFVMAQRINLLVDNVTAINVHFHNMVPDISHMHGNMIKMQNNMKSMDSMPIELSSMLGHLDNMYAEVTEIRQHVTQMEHQTLMISDKTNMLVTQLKYIEQPITQIQHHVGKTARPMRIFNQIMPRP